MHTDPDSDSSIYFSSRLETFTPGVPEPLTAPMLLGAVVGLLVARARGKNLL
jgi:hypothetical protein